MEINFPTQKFKDGLSKYKHQLEFLNIFDTDKIKKYYMLKWARRHGKSTLVFNILILSCLRYSKKNFAYIFPTRESAKKVIINTPEMMDMLPAQEYNGQIWTLNQSDLTIKFCNGSVLSIYGADKPGGLRGINAYGIVVDEWSQHKSDLLYTEVIEPVVRENKGWCIFIYTPCGVNFASEMYNDIITHRKGDEWYCSTLTAEQAGIIPHDELMKSRQNMGDLLYRQEFLCEDLADDDLVIIPQISINNLELVRRTQKYKKKCIAVDPALIGGDECICYHMENSEILGEKVITTRDTVVMSSHIQQYSNVIGCKTIVIDSIGIGKGVCDMLRDAGLNVIEFIASKKAYENDRFRNLKAEAWFHCKMQIELGRIPPITDPELKKQLSAVKYEYSGINNKIKCELKTLTKRRLGRSPDRADAFIMGVWAYEQLPDENRYKYISNLDKQRIKGSRPYDYMSS